VRAVQIHGPGTLALAEVPDPTAGPGQVLVRVRACGVCRTDLHELDGEVAIPHPPVIPGHQIVGTVLDEVEHSKVVDRQITREDIVTLLEAAYA